VVHEGAIDGGCRNHIELGQTRLICTVPSERYFHGAARFDDSTMLIYGGFSHRCEDYCDDLWSLDLRNVGSRNYSKTWTEVGVWPIFCLRCFMLVVDIAGSSLISAYCVCFPVLSK
jgi:hypothetical protein